MPIWSFVAVSLVVLSRIQAHSNDLAPGAIVDRDFQIVSLAGRGSFSTVYRALQRSRRQRLVALKVLHRGIQQELLRQAGRHRNPYLKEQLLCQRLKDSAVCRVIKVGSTQEGRFYVAMEWALGTTLEAHLSRERGPMPLRAAADVIVQLGRTLDNMHSSRIVHRDLKPGNIMLHVQPSGSMEVKIIDFGIAKMEDENDNIDGDQLLVGTPAYMSPEQAAGLRTDPRSDIFSLGAVTYEMLTGKRHIQLERPRSSSDGYVDYLRSGRPLPTVPPSQMNPSLGPAVDDILGRALARASDRRPKNMVEFLDAMIPSLHASEPEAPRLSLLRRTWLRLTRQELG